MKREIKFRGRRLDGKGWAVGSYLVSYGRHIIASDNVSSKTYEVNLYEVDPATVGQYTGLNDKNGREIYEEDVLRMYDNKRYTFTCIYPQTQSVFLGKCNETQLGFVNITEEVSKEIIGNIHDNPEITQNRIKLQKNRYDKSKCNVRVRTYIRPHDDMHNCEVF